jgi:release factor glutamine methyltransferase
MVAMSGPGSRTDLVGEVAARVGSRREAVWIVEHAEGAAPGGDGPAGVSARALVLADRRADGEPLQYVLGIWPFRILELEVDRRVLIPRPETEQLVSAALLELDRIALGRDPGEPLVCVDLGTGSGAIALSLASEGDRGRVLEIWATDVSDDALTVARANRERLARSDPDGAARVTLAAGDWFAALPGEMAGAVDLVVSNPPYVSEEEYAGLEEDVRGYEPRSALVAGPDGCGRPGMAGIEAVVVGSAQWLRPSGGLVVELAPSQARPASDVARRAGFTRAGTRRDLAGRLRMLVAER